jgi:hypothetical protein
MDKPAQYEIQVEGMLSSRWAEWFPNLTMTNLEEKGSLVTILTGSIPDQAAMLGMLQTIHNLGLLVLSVRRLCQS